MRSNSIKRMLCLLVLLTLPALLFPLRAQGAEEGREAPDYDGYLVYLLRELAPAEWEQYPELEPVVEGVCRTPLLSEAEELVSAGLAERFEPNYTASFWEDTASLDSLSFTTDGWAYEAMNTSFASAYSLNGAGVRIGIIDSGIDPGNPDLKQARILEGKDYIDNGSAANDTVYHGTRVAQVIAAGRNLLGGTGIAGGAELVPLRCFSTKSNGTADKLARAILDAVNVFHCDIINMSWGMKADTQILRQAIRYAWDHGVILIAAAGNVDQQSVQGTLLYPAAYPEVIGVGAVDKNLSILSSSQNTAAAEIYAPGGQLRFCSSIGTTEIYSGTSFAAPCVSAAAALLKQLAPFLTPEEVHGLIPGRTALLNAASSPVVEGAGFSRVDLLLKNGWYGVRRADDAAGAAVELRSWLLNKGGGIYLAAAYSPAGRLKCLKLSSQAEDSGSIQCTMEGLSDGDTVALFSLDPRLQILADSPRTVITSTETSEPASPDQEEESIEPPLMESTRT